MSELNEKKAGIGLIECSSDFEVAWKAADPVHNCEKVNPYAVTDSDSHGTLGQTALHTSQTSFIKAGSPNSENNGLSSSPAILHLPLHCQTQIRGRASWDNNGSHQGSVLSGNSADVDTDSKEVKQDNSSPTTEERNGMVVIRSTDRAVFSDHTDTKITSESPWSFSASLCHNTTGTQMTSSREGVEEDCELLRPRQKVATAKEGSLAVWDSSDPLGAPPHREDAFFKSDGLDKQEEDQIIEVDGWCHLPKFPAKSSTPKDKAMQTCWGLPEAEVRVWGAQILLALESLHQQGILCRDLNPRNILLTTNGKFNLLLQNTAQEKKKQSF